MKTVITEEIDGYQVIKDFGRPAIDPMATNPIINKILSESSEVDKMKELINQYRLTREQGSAAELEKIKNDIKDLKIQIQNKRKGLYDTKAIYFELKSGTETISENEFDILLAKFKNLSPNKKLLKNGTIIDDDRETSYMIKENSGRWEKKDIEKLGEQMPSSAKKHSDLTASDLLEIREQKIMDRYNSLSESGKEEYKNSLQKSALTRAAVKKSELELQNDLDALSKAKAYLEDEKKKIEEKYA